jgi:pyruvate kinase
MMTPVSNPVGTNGFEFVEYTAPDTRGLKIDADYVAVSFPRTADDIHEARMLLNRAGSSAGIVAKIERAEALDVIDEIIIASDAIMVARGDLGVEIGDANLPPVQKDLIKRARALDKVAITATQMMESMITNPIPTRAEVFDVANAVVDGTDVIMLSAETAAGKYPIKAIEAMDRVCLETEKQPNVRLSNHRVESQFERSDEAIAMSAMYLANHGNCKAIVSLTCTGSTPLWMSRISSGIPIFAFTHDPKTASKVTLYRGVFPFLFEDNAPDQETRYQAIFDIMKNRHQVSDDDNIIITHGDFHRVEGGTNTLQIVKVR